MISKTELARTIEMTQEEVSMLKNKLQLDSEILTRYEKLAAVGAESELQFLSQKNGQEETRGNLMQSRRSINSANQRF